MSSRDDAAAVIIYYIHCQHSWKALIVFRISLRSYGGHELSAITVILNPISE